MSLTQMTKLVIVTTTPKVMAIASSTASIHHFSEHASCGIGTETEVLSLATTFSQGYSVDQQVREVHYEPITGQHRIRTVYCSKLCVLC